MTMNSRPEPREAASAPARWTLASCLCLSLIALACAGPSADPDRPQRRAIDHEYALIEGLAHTPEIRKALVFPMNATVKRTPGLHARDERLLTLIDAYLLSEGVETSRLSVREYNRLNRIALDRAQARRQAAFAETGTDPGPIRFEDLVPTILEQLDSDAQIVLLPNLKIRDARYANAKTVRWDGVRRRQRGIAGWKMEGTTKAGSLFVLLLDPEGKEIFRGYGGLDLLFQPDMRNSVIRVREDLFENDAHLAEGVCVSFHPYFGNERC